MPDAEETADDARTESPGAELRRRIWRRRAVDWLIGAAGLLVVLLLLAVVLWFSVSRPVSALGGTDPEPVPSPTGEAMPPTGLGEEQVWFGDVDLGSASLIAAGTPLLDVEATGRDVLSGPDGITAGWVDLTGTVPFHVIAAELGPDTIVEGAGESSLRVTRTVDLLGRALDVVATGTVAVENGRLVMEPTHVDIDGGGFLSAVVTELARTFVRIEHEIEGLPEGLSLREVEIVEDGARARLEGAGVRLSQQP